MEKYYTTEELRELITIEQAKNIALNDNMVDLHEVCGLLDLLLDTMNIHLGLKDYASAKQDIDNIEFLENDATDDDLVEFDLDGDIKIVDPFVYLDDLVSEIDLEQFLKEGK